MEKLIPKVLNAAYSAREGGDCKELFLNSLLATYADEKKDIKKDQVSQIFLGKRTIPKTIVRFYASGASMCPPKLYGDISEYFRNAKKETVKALQEGICEILTEIPEEDAEDLLRGVNVHKEEKEKTCALLTCLIYRAWRCDLAGYTFSYA